MTAERRAQLQALADWITRGPTPERVRLAAMLRPMGVGYISIDSDLTEHQVRAYMEGRCMDLKARSCLWLGWDMLAARVTETNPDGWEERDRLHEALDSAASWREELPEARQYRRNLIAKARHHRIAARELGWRLP